MDKELEIIRNYSIEVHKYKPEGYNKKGHYQLNEWTCYSDIGKEFNKKIFTLEEYLKVENQYIDAIHLFLNEVKSKNVRIKGLKKNSTAAEFKKYDDLDLFDYYNSVKESMILELDKIDDLAKLVLRNYLWCELISTDKEAKIVFGYDYYMGFIYTGDLTKIKNEIIKLGLHLDRMH